MADVGPGHHPCRRPCQRRNRYLHKHYVLGAVPPDLKRPDQSTLEKAMRAHVLAEILLIGACRKGG